jgi:hypothetical protein
VALALSARCSASALACKIVSPIEIPTRYSIAPPC